MIIHSEPAISITVQLHVSFISISYDISAKPYTRDGN